MAHLNMDMSKTERVGFFGSRNCMQHLGLQELLCSDMTENISHTFFFHVLNTFEMKKKFLSHPTSDVIETLPQIVAFWSASDMNENESLQVTETCRRLLPEDNPGQTLQKHPKTRYLLTNPNIFSVK